MRRLIIILAMLPAVLLSTAQQRSTKRGIGWDESAVSMQQAHMEQFAPGVSWMYNWGNAPKNPTLYSSTTMAFLPMCWNNNFNEPAIRQYLTAHPETKYLLGFNEPNFSSQSNMTPERAAQYWPQLEQIANDFGLKLVSPALNFSSENVGGRKWNPYEWLDEFLRLRPTAKIDCIALHCYMNWYSANTWFATEYFYKDLYDRSKTNVYGRYPHIVAYLDAYKAEHGHFPKMMLTEFCAWENDGTITGPDFQLDQMTQKVQKLEQSDLVEGYAWFMANANASAYPYMSLLQTNSATATLSTLGTVYVNMSSFDMDKYYAADEEISAKDYVEATTDERQIRLRPNSEAGSAQVLQVEYPTGSWATYQIDVPEDGDYTMTLHVKTTQDLTVMLYVDSRRNTSTSIETTNGQWEDRTFNATLTAGRHQVMLYNADSAPLLINSWHFSSNNAGLAAAEVSQDGEVRLYDLQGRPITDLSNLQRGIYIMVTRDGAQKIIR